MIYWLIPVSAVILFLAGLNWSRLGIPRDLTKEKLDDYESSVEYDRVNHWPIFKFIRHFYIRQLNKYHPRGTIMDAGCGPGCLALDIAARFSNVRVIGVDISRIILDLAVLNQKRAAPGLKVYFQQASVQQLPLADASIDFTVSTLSLHHWTHPEKAFEEIYRVTRPGGRMLVFDLRRDLPRSLFFLVRFVQRFIAAPPIRRVNGGEGSVWSSYTPAEMRSFMENSPFKHWEVQARWGWAYIYAQK